MMRPRWEHVALAVSVVALMAISLAPGAWWVELLSACAALGIAFFGGLVLGGRLERRALSREEPPRE